MRARAVAAPTRNALRHQRITLAQSIKQFRDAKNTTRLAALASPNKRPTRKAPSLHIERTLDIHRLQRVSMGCADPKVLPIVHGPQTSSRELGDTNSGKTYEEVPTRSSS